jgi:hypothetical protein
MDKLKFIIILCFLSCILHLPASALLASSSITVVVTVQGTFNLMVNTDSFDFDRLAPGQTGEMSRAEGMEVAGTSSGENPWYLKVSAEKPLTSGNNTIPNEDFTWHGTSEGTGDWSGTEEKSLADPNVAAYMSSAEESDQVKKVINRFNFLLHVPEDTKPGEYSTTVMFTMTE